MGMKLDKEQIMHLKDVTDFILTFEEKDYEDWVRDTGNVDGHVYWKARELAWAMNKAGITIVTEGEGL